MRPFLSEPVSRIKGEITLPGDKAIAHRSIIISALTRGKTVIENFPCNKDCFYTLEAFRKLGIEIKYRPSAVITVVGKGLYGLKKTLSPIFVGDSGTTLRLLLGVLAAQGFKTKIITGKSLAKRPMLRVTEPLRKMGAEIQGTGDRGQGTGEEYPPIRIKGGRLKPITYKMPVASAQVKSAILLAGLFTKGKTKVIELLPARDHTERMLKLFKAGLKVKKNTITIDGAKELVSPGKIYLPADISSAGFFMVMAAIIPGSRVLIKKVGLNPSRAGIIKVLKRMGANIRFAFHVSRFTKSEPMGDILVKGSRLKATVVKKKEIPSLIDELPILMVAACFARGKTIFEGAGELRVKETDRINSMASNLRKMGGCVEVFKRLRSEDIVVYGVAHLHGARVKSFGDHRTAMSMVVAGLKATGKTCIDDISCINKSFPEFISVLKTLRQ